jgi:VIT1/CCC1 family predicted Fe2+/Mn2+ transporter
MGEFDKVLSEKSNKELDDILSAEIGNYQKDFIKAAKIEIEKRQGGDYKSTKDTSSDYYNEESKVAKGNQSISDTQQITNGIARIVFVLSIIAAGFFVFDEQFITAAIAGVSGLLTSLVFFITSAVIKVLIKIEENTRPS